MKLLHSFLDFIASIAFFFQSDDLFVYRVQSLMQDASLKEARVMIDILRENHIDDMYALSEERWHELCLEAIDRTKEI